MRSVAEYLQKAEEFDRLAAKTEIRTLRNRYNDLAECYRLLANERQSLINLGQLQPD